VVNLVQTDLTKSDLIPIAELDGYFSLSAHLRSTLISSRQFRDGSKSHIFADAYF